MRYHEVMRQTQLFTKTRREAPKDEESKNAQLLIRGGYINKEMAGVYSLLPLGLKMVNKIKKIVSEEMDGLGSQEIIMSTLQNKEIWQKTDRWSDENVDVWFKSKLKNDTEIGFGWSHEEPIVEMMKSHITSYTELPVYVHQFQNKLRNEVRAKAGVMRSREFIMKDMYAFSTTEENNLEFYNKTIEAYKNVFARLGLGEITYVTSASGGVFTDKFSHEFQTVCEAGEDNIYVNKEKKIALNEEIFNEKTLEDMSMKESDFEKQKAAEVGNIFNFGTKKSEEMGLSFQDKEGNKKPVFLSSFGIGITRLMGVIAEVFGNDKGIIWPESVAPFKYHLIEVISSESKVRETALRIYTKLGGENALYDDRDLRMGEKLADSDLFGIPAQIIVSEKTLEKGLLEIKNRKTGETTFVEEKDLV